MRPCDFELYRPNPKQLGELALRPVPKKTAYRRAVYAMALDRLQAIADSIRDFDTKHTGKVYRDEFGDAVGRGKGVMPSLIKQFPELRGWDAGPAALLKTIRQAKAPAYFGLLGDTIDQVEGDQGEQLELFIASAPAAELREFPPVMYPAHKGNRRCRHCRQPHAAALHRFHLRGSFDATHPTPAEKESRQEQRRRDRSSDLPSWVTEEF